MEEHIANALARVLERLRAAVDRRDGLRLLAEHLVEALPCARVTLWRKKDRTRPFTLRAAHPALETEPGSSRLPLAIEDLPWSAGLTRGGCVTLRAGVPGCDDDALRDAMAAEPGDDVLLVPFTHGARLEVLAACVRSDGTFAEATVRMWEKIAPHVAVVLSNWRLEEASSGARSYRHHFAALAADVVQAEDVEATAVRLCELTRALFGTTRSALFMLEDRDLVPIAAAGPYGDRAAGGTLHVPPGVEPIFDEALRTGQVMVVNDFRSSPWVEAPIPLPFRPQAAMVIPLVDTTGTLGILTASELDEPQRFGASSAEEGRMLGAVTTVAIRRMLLLEELRRAGRTKDEFLAAVSHELRTPLNVVLGYVQLLSEHAFGPLTPEQADSIHRVEMGARSQLALVNDLLDLAAIERGAIHCDFGPVRLSDLAPELEDVVQGLIAARPIAFSIDLPAALVARTDRERLKQVLVNLLANAAKFTARGRISVQACAEGDSVAIEVADTGAGMEPAFVQRATEPFVRGEGKAAGSGLGLAIVSRVLRALGGELAIESRPGEGTTVRIRLPAAEPEHAAREDEPRVGAGIGDERDRRAGGR